MKRGVFITFEGPEGCGKSTHSRLLVRFLKAQGYRVVSVREPGSTRIGERIRRLLLDKENNLLSYECEMLLYMAARCQLVQEVIRPALKEGKVVLCDRFLDSTIAYQGYGLGLDVGLIKRLGKAVLGGFLPDLTILLDRPPKKGLQSRPRSKDRIESRPLVYHQRVRQGYLALQKAEPERIKLIKIDKNKSRTQDKIRRLVMDFLQRKKRVRYAL